MRVVDRLFQFGVFLTVIWFVGLGAWWLGSTLSSDAIGLALGVIFGIVAALPGSLLALAAGRRSVPAQLPAQQWPPSPPVIVITGSTPAALPSREQPLLVDHWSEPQAQEWRDVRPEGQRNNTDTAMIDRERREILTPGQYYARERERQAQQAPRVIEGEVQPQRSSPAHSSERVYLPTGEPEHVYRERMRREAQSDAEGGWYDD